MKSLKRIIASTLSVLMILASLLTVNVFADTVVFPDVADDYAYRSAIYSLVDKGVINGIEENGVLNFKPDNTITRAEFAKLVAVALTGGVALTETTAQFPDVAQDYWANVHIAYAVKTGIVLPNELNDINKYLKDSVSFYEPGSYTVYVVAIDEGDNITTSPVMIEIEEMKYMRIVMKPIPNRKRIITFEKV